MNISYIELFLCLRSFEVPFHKEDLISLAKRNGASLIVLNALQSLTGGIYENLHEVMLEIKAQQKSGNQLILSSELN